LPRGRARLCLKGVARLTHLLVDGCNILHAWPETRRVLARNYDAACAQLAEELRAIHDVETVRVTVVFDGKGDKPQVTYPGGGETFAVVYAPSDWTADALIERMALRAGEPEGVMVASRDNLLTQSVLAAGGSRCSPETLSEWVADCHRRQAQRLERQRRRNEKAWKEDSPWKILDQ